jgi:hypothetical protein
MAHRSWFSVRASVIVLAMLAVIGAGASTASAATYFVVSGGQMLARTCTKEPSNAGDPSQGCDLYTAIQNVASDDTVVIEPGPEKLTQGTLKTPANLTNVWITGVDAEHPATIDDTNPSDAIAFDVGSGVSLADIQVTYSAASPVTSTPIALQFAGARAERVVARASTGVACHVVSSSTTTPDLVDSACVVGSGTALSESVTSAGGAGKAQLENVTAVSTASSGTNHAISAIPGSGFAQLNVLALNTIAVTASGSALFAVSSGSVSTATLTLDHSSYTSSSTGNGGTINVDSTSIDGTRPPVFAGSSSDPLAFDLHERPGSPTVATGTPLRSTSDGQVPVGGSQDVDGDHRVRTTANPAYDTIDIGADQYVPAPTQRYASVGGKTNAASCPSSTPCDLASALGAAGDGDEVILAPGRYDLGQGSLVDDDVPVSLRGAGSGRTVIVSDSSDPTLGMDASSTVSDLELDNAQSDALALGLGVDAERIVARSAGGSGCSVDASVTLRDSICVSSAPVASAAAGLLMSASGDFVLRNVTAIGAAYGIRVQPGSSKSQGTMTNVIARGSAAGADVEVDAAAAALALAISHSNYATTKLITPVTVTISDDARQAAAPSFVNPTGSGSDPYDFHEAAGSPTRGAGVVAQADVYTTDVDGELRVSADGKIDIGGDQSYAPPPPTTTPDTTTTTPGTTTTTPVTTPTPPTGDHVSPAFSRLLLTPVRFAMLANGQRPKPGVVYKTSVSFSVTEPAVVRAVVQVKAMGRKVGTACQKPSRKNRHARPCQLSGRLVGGVCQKQSAKNKSAPACKLWTTVGVAFSESVKAGPTSVVFTGKVGKTALKPGSYRLVLTATDSARNGSVLEAVSFVIKKG